MEQGLEIIRIEFGHGTGAGNTQNRVWAWNRRWEMEMERGGGGGVENTEDKCRKRNRPLQIGFSECSANSGLSIDSETDANRIGNGKEYIARA